MESDKKLVIVSTRNSEVKPSTMSSPENLQPSHHLPSSSIKTLTHHTNITGNYIDKFPPGYRFKPTHEELLRYYLRKKIQGQDELPWNRIHNVDVYRYSPFELSEKFEAANSNEGEWYFFSPREKKYKNGTRPKRGASNGYWKATGADKIIMYFEDGTTGLLKTLVYYEGTPKEGTKTGWIMKEYRIGKDVVNDHNDPADEKEGGSMKLDDWVLYKIYEKISKRSAGNNGESNEQEDNKIVNIDEGVGHPQNNFQDQSGDQSFSKGGGVPQQLPYYQEYHQEHHKLPADINFHPCSYNQQNNNAMSNTSISNGAAQQQQQPQQQLWPNDQYTNYTSSINSMFANDTSMDNHHMHGGGFYQGNHHEMMSSYIYNQQPGNMMNMSHDPAFNSMFQDLSQALMPAAPADFNNVQAASSNESNVPQMHQHQQSQMMTRPSSSTNYHPYR